METIKIPIEFAKELAEFLFWEIDWGTRVSSQVEKKAEDFSQKLKKYIQES